MAINLQELKKERDDLYPHLKEAYIANKPEYSAIKERVDGINERIKYLSSGKEDITQRKYSPSLGVYVDPTKKSSEEEIKDRIERLREPGKKISEQDLADREWQKKCLLDHIKGNQWLNTIQVEAATGKAVPIGAKELNKFIQENNGNPPISFGYIVEGKNKQNHFVSFDIRKVGNKTEITYVDSNGDLMPEKERQMLGSKFPGLEIKYLDKNGEKILESKANSENLLRVQFDDHNCGLYTTHIVNMLKATGGNPQAEDIARIKQITNTPSSYRSELSNVLKQIAENPSMEHQIREQFASKSQSRRLLEKSPTVSSSANLGLQSSSNQLETSFVSKLRLGRASNENYLRVSG